MPSIRTTLCELCFDFPCPFLAFFFFATQDRFLSIFPHRWVFLSQSSQIACCQSIEQVYNTFDSLSLKSVAGNRFCPSCPRNGLQEFFYSVLFLFFILLRRPCTPTGSSRSPARFVRQNRHFYPACCLPSASLAEHSHEPFLTSVRASLALNNPAGIVDPVFGLLGNAAAASGAGKITVLKLICSSLY